MANFWLPRLAGELEIGVGLDKMDALKNREVVLSDYGDSDYLEENTLLGNMGWKKWIKSAKK